MQKKVRFVRNKIFATTALIWGLALPQYALADEPDDFQLKVTEPYQDKFSKEILDKYQQGVFDLQNEKSTFVSVATKSLLGTSPGIRTIATVNNDIGQLRACSTVTLHYQIIDIDGDWDPDKTYQNVPDGADGFYEHKKTSDTIEWGIELTIDGEKRFISLTDPNYAMLISNDRLKLTIPLTIEVDGKSYSTEGASLTYQLIPHTMIGSNPYHPENYDYVVVDDLTAGKFLMPGAASGVDAEKIASNEILLDIKDTDVDLQNKLNQQHYLTFPGLPNPEVVPNSSFILNKTIEPANPEDCLVPQSQVDVEIYAASDDTKSNVITPGAWSGRPPVFVKNRYQAEVVIIDDEGNKRQLTRAEYENKELPFTWNIYYSTDTGNCPITEEYLAGFDDLDKSCLEKISFNSNTRGDVATRFGAQFNKDNNTEVLEYAWIDLQNVNDDKLVESDEGSEQGAIISVSLGYDALTKY
ncbi:hypothetical protein [Thorsellia kenyensis]|uniref:DUF4179 domain-containing protein n=1 Tax=Thorsellia kenyensis TaxID=1549888 RepID=A0ABV6CE43_9GAMM